MKPDRIDTERLQAMLDYANSRAIAEDRANREAIRQELEFVHARAILAGITQPWED